MQSPALSKSFEELIALAVTGKLALLDLIESAQQLAEGGFLDQAISLYQQWLTSTASPHAHMAHFNLGVNLVRAKRDSEAEQAYRQAIRQKPDFKEAYLNLSSLLHRTARLQESLNVLILSNIPELQAEAERRRSGALQEAAETAKKAVSGNAHAIIEKATQVHNGLYTRPKIAKQAAGNLPLVSIMIPTHNRPEYFEWAFKSAIAQTYPNIEIVISDNGDNDLTQEFITPYLDGKRIKYHREQGMTAYNNWCKCIELASAEYVSYLMDDDLLHPEKIARMMNYMVKHPNVGIVTSFRQLIDQHGDFLPPANPTEQLFPKDTMITGPNFGEFILKNGRNVLGEPTTVLIKREAIAHGFGWYFGEQFAVLSDVATWLSILHNSDCVYIADALSYFRQHPGQDQMNSNMKVRATVDWFRLFLLSHKNGVYVKQRSDFHEMLAVKLHALMNYITQNHAELRDKKYNQADIEQLITAATHELLTA